MESLKAREDASDVEKEPALLSAQGVGGSNNAAYELEHVLMVESRTKCYDYISYGR